MVDETYQAGTGNEGGRRFTETGAAATTTCFTRVQSAICEQAERLNDVRASRTEADAVLPRRLP